MPQNTSHKPPAPCTETINPSKTNLFDILTISLLNGISEWHRCLRRLHRLLDLQPVIRAHRVSHPRQDPGGVESGLPATLFGTLQKYGPVGVVGVQDHVDEGVLAHLRLPNRGVDFAKGGPHRHVVEVAGVGGVSVKVKEKEFYLGHYLRRMQYFIQIHGFF